ncbi:MAG: hypothetical protein RL220_559 [Bacteroidota bacterium]
MIALCNLTVLALLGFLLRYKIAFSLPILDQKHLLHAHSHFAFSGWVSLALMILQVFVVSTRSGNDLFRRYRVIFWIQLVSCWGMLFSFVVQGYGAVSIAFSTLSILLSYYYSFMLWRDMRHGKGYRLSALCFKVALLSSALSTLGAFGLSLLMATHTANQHLYLAALYFFLHFQYNGWFIITLLGVAAFFIERSGHSSDRFRKHMWYIIAALGPSYFLSTLWMELPMTIYIMVVLSAIVQLLGWAGIVKILLSELNLLRGLSPGLRNLIVLVLLAFSVKVLLQAGSTIPSLSTLAFGFRPIVIGYLHLVLLGVVTLGILSAFIGLAGDDLPLRLRLGIHLFYAGVILNEFLLMLQGVAAMGYVVLPFTNEGLLFIAGMLLNGSVLIVLGWRKLISQGSIVR